MTANIPLSLTKIGFYNPGRLTDEEIEQSFIARVPFFEFLFKKIIAEKQNSIPQQHLIIGQRGMGKSSLLIRIAAELRKSPHKKAFIPLSFPEEQYNIDRLSKFWLNCLDALADALDKENKTTDLSALDAEILSLSKEKDLSANNVYGAFKKWGDKINRRPVLLVDNLSLIFEKIDRDEQHQLRAVLMSEGAPILIGTSAATIAETVDYKAPFYDAFQISYLKKLTFDESIEVLLNLAKITGNEGFGNSVYKERGRLHALYQLTGGTPRTIAILFPLIQGGFSEDIQTDLDALLDIITPIYKARFEELPAQLQVVLDAIALHWDPINLEQLRDVTMLDNGQLSPQLKRLVEVGWLEKLDAYKAKGNAYEVSERFFNVWYLMRRSSRRQKRELYCLTKFLESFYGDGLQKIAKSRLYMKNENASQAALDLALADAVKGKKLGERLRNKAYEALIEMSFHDDNISKSFNIPVDVSLKKARTLVNKANDHYNKNEFIEAEICLTNLLKIDKNNRHVWVLLGIIYDSLLKYLDAEKAFKKAIELDEKDADSWTELGNLYQDRLAKYEEAEEAYKKAIELDEKGTDQWYNLGRLYNYALGQYIKAEVAYKQAIELDGNFAAPWNNLGDLYKDHLQKYQEAETAYKNATELDKTSSYAQYGLGVLYQDHLEMYEEAEIAFKKAVELDGKDVDSWAELGKLYRDHLAKYKEAEFAYKKAIEIDEKNAHLWNGLGILYSYYLSRYVDAEAAYKKAIELGEKDGWAWGFLGDLYQYYLNKYPESETAYKKSIELNGQFTHGWHGLGNLYKERLSKYPEAEFAYKKAIELDENNTKLWYNLGKLYKDNLGRNTEAEGAFRQAIKLDEKEVAAWNSLGNLYADYLHKYEDAEEAYIKALEIDPSTEIVKHNLVFLWRDKMGKVKEARELFNTLTKTDAVKDSYLLNEALFAYYEKNAGIAANLLKEALLTVGDTLPAITTDDWYRTATVIVKLGFGENLLSVLSANGYDVIFKPLYVAIKALTQNEGDLFFNSIAAEVREPARKILEIMKNYMV